MFDFPIPFSFSSLPRYHFFLLRAFVRIRHVDSMAGAGGGEECFTKFLQNVSQAFSHLILTIFQWGWLISPFKVLHDPAPNTFITLFSNPPLCMHFIQSCLIKLVYFLFFNVNMESRDDYLSEPQFHHLENKKY